jgi:hypothetical protein
MKEPGLKHYDDVTGKLHISCPHRERTGIYVHVVVKDGYCYRSHECMVVECRYNKIQSDIKKLLSLTW